MSKRPPPDRRHPERVQTVPRRFTAPHAVPGADEHPDVAAAGNDPVKWLHRDHSQQDNWPFHQHRAPCDHGPNRPIPVAPRRAQVREVAVRFAGAGAAGGGGDAGGRGGGCDIGRAGGFAAVSRSRACRNQIPM